MFGASAAQLQVCDLSIAPSSATSLQGLRQRGQQISSQRCHRPRALCLQYEKGSQARKAAHNTHAHRPQFRCRARVEDQEGLQELADALEASLDAGRRQTRFRPFIADVRL